MFMAVNESDHIVMGWAERVIYDSETKECLTVLRRTQYICRNVLIWTPYRHEHRDPDQWAAGLRLPDWGTILPT